MGRPYFDEHGAPARMLGISLDISERKRLEERRREDTSEIKRLKKLLEKENTILREELKQQLGTHTNYRQFTPIQGGHRRGQPGGADNGNRPDSWRDGDRQGPHRASYPSAQRA